MKEQNKPAETPHFKHSDSDWEAKEIRKRIDAQKVKVQSHDLIERAFVLGYFNQINPPASFVNDISDGHLSEAWERCKSFLIDPSIVFDDPDPSPTKEKWIPEDIMQWIKQHEKRLWEITAGDKGHPSNWKNGAIAMYHFLQKWMEGYRISNQNIVDQNCSLLDERARGDETYKKLRDDYIALREESDDYRNMLQTIWNGRNNVSLLEHLKSVSKLLNKYSSTSEK